MFYSFPIIPTAIFTNRNFNGEKLKSTVRINGTLKLQTKNPTVQPKEPIT